MRKRKKSLFFQILSVLALGFSLIFMLSLWMMWSRHIDEQNVRLKNTAKTISVGLSQIYYQSIFEDDIGKITFHNTQVIDINPNLLYLTIYLHTHGKVIVCKNKKWSEVPLDKVGKVEMNKGKLVSVSKSPYDIDRDVYEYTFLLKQFDEEYGWFQIGMDIKDDQKYFQRIILQTILFEAIIFVVLIIFGYFFANKISKPILSLHEGVQRLSAGNYDVQVYVDTDNEVRELAESFNQMTKRISQINVELELKVRERTVELEDNLRKLNEAQEAAREAAMQAGMAEIATNVLHNVGNVLNSVNVSAGFIRELLMNSNVKNLDRINKLIQEHKDSVGDFISNDARGKLIPEYINELSKALGQEHSQFQNELERLMKKIDNIKDIISLQQDYASRSDIKVNININSVIEDSIMIANIKDKRENIQLIQELESLPELFLDKHKLIQIVVNLLKNAKEAMSDQSLEKIIKISLKIENNDIIKFSVEDSGPGITEEAMNHIFEHGFTTKRDGHGFGLHSCAIFAKNLGGQLYCKNKDEGTGAVFILELPLEGVLANEVNK